MKETVKRILLWPRRWDWHIIGAGICAAGVLHIVATFAAPSLVLTTAYDRLAASLPANTMQVLPPVTPQSQPLPFLAPDASYAVCRFDARNGSVAITAVLPEPGWSLALFTPQGENVYTAVAPPGRRIDVQLTLVPSEDRFTGLTPEARGESRTAEQSLTVAAEQGLAVLRAPDQGASRVGRNREALALASCAFKPL